MNAAYAALVFFVVFVTIGDMMIISS